MEGDSLLLLFAHGFHVKHPNGTKVHMRFNVERHSSRTMHRAVDDTMLELVWPNPPPALTSAHKIAVDT